MRTKIRRKMIFLASLVLLLASGCAPFSPQLEKETVEDPSHITLGHSLEVHNGNSSLVLVDHNGTLAADGLFYASWGMGEPQSYENSDGETADLYDANLYLLLGESKNHDSAQGNMDTWLAAARENYEVLQEEEFTCNGQDYTLLTYNCISEDNPYDHGISVFGAVGGSAVCMELACRETFEGDLTEILTEFINDCTYIAD